MRNDSLVQWKGGGAKLQQPISKHPCRTLNKKAAGKPGNKTHGTENNVQNTHAGDLGGSGVIN